MKCSATEQPDVPLSAPWSGSFTTTGPDPSSSCSTVSSPSWSVPPATTTTPAPPTLTSGRPRYRPRRRRHVSLEQALRNAEFEPDSERVWRWRADSPDARTIVKFELLADLGDQPSGAEIHFDGCEALGAANLRGTGFASRDSKVRRLTFTSATSTTSPR